MNIKFPLLASLSYLILLSVLTQASLAAHSFIHSAHSPYFFNVNVTSPLGQLRNTSVVVPAVAAVELSKYTLIMAGVLTTFLILSVIEKHHDTTPAQPKAPALPAAVATDPAENDPTKTAASVLWAEMEITPIVGLAALHRQTPEQVLAALEPTETNQAFTDRELLDQVNRYNAVDRPSALTVQEADNTAVLNTQTTNMLTALNTQVVTELAALNQTTTELTELHREIRAHVMTIQFILADVARTNAQIATNIAVNAQAAPGQEAMQVVTRNTEIALNTQAAFNQSVLNQITGIQAAVYDLGVLTNRQQAELVALQPAVATTSAAIDTATHSVVDRSVVASRLTHSCQEAELKDGQLTKPLQLIMEDRQPVTVPKTTLGAGKAFVFQCLIYVTYFLVYVLKR